MLSREAALRLLMLCLWSGLKPTCAPASLSEQTHLGPAGRDSGCGDLRAGCWKPSLVTVRFSAAGPHRFSCNPGGAKPEYEHDAVGGGNRCWMSLEGPEPQGRPLPGVLCQPLEGMLGSTCGPFLPSNAVGLSVHSAGHFSLTAVL